MNLALCCSLTSVATNPIIRSEPPAPAGPGESAPPRSLPTALLARGLAGKTVLFGAGPGLFRETPAHSHEFVPGGEDLLIHSLGALGVRPEEVDVVVLTDLQWMHAGGLLMSQEGNEGSQLTLRFPNATVIVRRETFKQAERQSHLDGPSYPGELVGLLRDSGRLIPVDQPTTLLLGDSVRILEVGDATSSRTYAEILTQQGLIVWGMDNLQGLTTFPPNWRRQIVDGGVYLYLPNEPEIVATQVRGDGERLKPVHLLGAVDWVTAETTGVWPDDFARISEEPWTTAPVEERALAYDGVDAHTWYDNLDPTVQELAEGLRDGDVVIDYAGGTGILTRRLLRVIGRRDVGIMVVDTSPAFLRLALRNFGWDARVAFRHLQYRRGEKRLDHLHEVAEVGADVIVSANAVHLFPDPKAVFESWRRVVKPDGRILIQSGNIRNPEMPAGNWIIDDTVHALHRQAMEIARRDDRFAPYRAALNDEALMGRYDTLRDRYFIPVRPLDFYLQALDEVGFTKPPQVKGQSVIARVDEWLSFLKVYHDGILGWVGGAEKITGVKPSAEALRDRLLLMELAMGELFKGQSTFEAYWTHITCEA